LGLKVGLLCKITKVSRSGYYRWLKSADEPDRDHGDYLLINELFAKGKGKHGHRVITMKLSREKKIIMNHKKVMRIMNKFGLTTRIRRRNPYKMIMKKSQEHRTCENILDRTFKQRVPLRALCTDITYLWFGHRFAYLSVIKDIASREIVAWSLSWHLGMSLVFETINGLKQTANRHSWALENVLLHSDQGFHYTNPGYIQEVKELKIRQSMSRKGNCIDNSPMESFFGHFKDEVDYKNCKTFDDLKHMVGEYIDYYNNDRQQWELKKMTPVEYRNHLLIDFF
jgi:transposase InsO family protein